jgi:hypothetical protein
MTHCQCELFHAQWAILLNDAFVEAYEHGIVIECGDGHARRFYPRIFAYMADYPEKYVIRATESDYNSQYSTGLQLSLFII